MKATSILVSRMMFHITVLRLRPQEREEGTLAHLFQWLFLNMLRVRFSNSGFLRVRNLAQTKTKHPLQSQTAFLELALLQG